MTPHHDREQAAGPGDPAACSVPTHHGLLGMGRGFGRREYALIGLAGAVRSGIGVVLILGRCSSGHDFDQATGVIPSHLDPDNRWLSLSNGATLGRHRIQIGTPTGLVGIGVLEHLGR